MEQDLKNKNINLPTTQVISESQSTILPRPQPSKKLIFFLVLLIVLLSIALIIFVFRTPASAPAVSIKTSAVTEVSSAKAEGLQLDPEKNYGNKYANGILPVSDKKSATTGAKRGYIYQCRALSSTGRGGAGARGPWFSADNLTWDVNKKSTINGNVSWQPNITMTIKDGKRVISTNSLPSHKTGIFPVQRSDPAYQYDANPNTISAQSLVYTLTEAPSYGAPQCMGMETGVMTTGAALFNGFDAEGRDAAAWEVQDSCDGHPQNKGEYHYHSLSRCITDQSVNKVIGYALDGFPITGPKVGANNILTTNDLDECHGIVSEIILDNVKKTTYHYVMTQDFPYSAGCFRATASQPPSQP